MPLKIGITNSEYEKFYSDPNDVIKLIADSGFDCVDYWLSSRYNVHTEAMNESTSQREDYFLKIKECADNNHISFYQTHATMASFANDKYDPIRIEAIQNCMEASHYLDAKYIVVHPCKTPHYFNLGIFMDKRKNLNMNFYNIIKPMAEKYDLVIAIENMFRGAKFPYPRLVPTTCSKAEEMIDILKGLNSDRFCLCYDSGHANIIYKDGGVELLNKIAPYTKVLHLHDNYNNRDSHEMPYKGNLNWNGVLQILKANNFDGCLNFEVELSRREDKTALKKDLIELAKIATDMASGF